jgi:hypothetical protein
MNLNSKISANSLPVNGNKLLKQHFNDLKQEGTK